MAYRPEQCSVFGWVEAMSLVRPPYSEVVEPMALTAHVVDWYYPAVEELAIAAPFERVPWDC